MDGTLAVDGGGAVTFVAVPSSLLTIHPSTASVPTSFYSTWLTL